MPKIITRGTTPTITFPLPVAPTLIRAAAVTFRQEGENRLEKTLAEGGLILTENRLLIPLTQPDTLQLQAGVRCAVQVKLKTGDTVIASAPAELFVQPIFSEEAM